MLFFMLLKKIVRTFLFKGKKIKRRKRHIVTDTKGYLLHINVHKANIHDTVSGCEIFKEALEKYPTLEGVCTDKRIPENF